MMTAKLCGGALLILAAAIIAGYRVRQIKRRENAARAMLALLRRIKTQIESYRAPLDRILAETDGELLSGFAKTAAEYGLCDALETHAESLCLGAKELSLLYECFEGMGQSFSESEAERCGYYAAELAELCGALSEETPKKIKLTLTLAAFFSLMAVLLFI